MAETNEDLLQPFVESNEEEPRNESSSKATRSSLIVGGIFFGVLVTVAVITAVTASRSPPKENAAPGDDNVMLEVVGAGPPVRPIMPQQHPILQNFGAEPQPSTDPATEVYSMSSNVQTAPNTYTKFNYHAEVVKDTQHLYSNEAALKVTCNNSFVNVTFNGTSEAKDFAASLNINSTYLTVNREWGCGAAHVRQIGHNVTVTNNQVTAHTSNVTFNKLFKHANITFTGTMVKGINSVEIQSNATAEVSKRNRRDLVSDVEDLWDTISGDIETALQNIDTVENDVDKFANIVASGNYSNSKQLWQKNLQQSNPCGSGEVGDLTTCSYAYDAEITFSILITNYNLEYLKLQTTGNANAGIATNGQPITKSWNGQQALPGFDKTLWSTVLMIGPIPVPLSIHGSMKNTFNWDVDASLSLNGNIGVEGDLTINTEYIPGSEPTASLQHSLTGQAAINYATGSLSTKGSITSNINLMLSAIYCADLSTQIVVSPSVSAVGTETVEGAAAKFSVGASGFTVTKVNPEDPPYDSPCHPEASSSNSYVDNPSLSINAGVGVDVTAAAKVDIEFEGKQYFDKTWPIGDGYSNLFQVGQWCIVPKI